MITFLDVRVDLQAYLFLKCNDELSAITFVSKLIDRHYDTLIFEEIKLRWKYYSIHIEKIEGRIYF